MATPTNLQRSLRFGPFEADVLEGKLYRKGLLVHLQDKPFQILVLLVEQLGKVVTREELRQRLWTADTFVEFDEGLNAAIAKLRAALGDSADRPVFVETVRRRGYRWIAPVEWVTPGDASTANPPTALLPDAAPGHVHRTDKTRSRVGEAVRNAGVGVALALLAVGGVLLWHRTLPLRTTDAPSFKIRQLTNNSSEDPVRSGAISPDGRYLAYSDLGGVHVKRIETGETRVVPTPDDLKGARVDWQVMAWFPDGSHFIANIAPFFDVCLNCEHFSAWVFSTTGDPPRKLRDDVNAESISPDGSLIAFTAKLGIDGGHEIWITSANGAQPRKVLETSPSSWVAWVKWSPDGRRLAYIRSDEKEGVLESRDLNGGPATAILTPFLLHELHDYVWATDGRIIYARNEPGSDGKSCNYWEVLVDSRSGEPTENPRRLTNWAGFALDFTSISADGKRLAFAESADYSVIHSVTLEHKGTRTATPRQLTFNQSWNQPFAWTSDSQTIVFGSDRDGSWGIYRQSLHPGESATPIVTGLRDFSRHSPVAIDGAWVLYVAAASVGQTLTVDRLMRIPLVGGPSKPVPTGGDIYGVSCARAPVAVCVMVGPGTDHQQLVFSQLDPEKGGGRELTRFNLPTNDEHWDWRLSPDGALIALFKPAGGDIYLLPVSGQRVRQVHLKGWSTLYNLNWSADGKSLFVANPTPRGSALLHVDLQGNTIMLWEQKGGLAPWGIPSPDGRRLAIMSWNLSSNVWMLENP